MKKKLEDGSIVMLNTYLKLYIPHNILQKYPSSWHIKQPKKNDETSGNTNLALTVLWVSLGVFGSFAKDWLHVWA